MVYVGEGNTIQPECLIIITNWKNKIALENMLLH